MGGSSKKKKTSATTATTTTAVATPEEWKKQIVSLLKGAAATTTSKGGDDDHNKSNVSLPIKKLRRMVLLSILQQDEDDDDDDDQDNDQRKVAKKTFKKTVQMLETDGVVSLNADGVITLLRHNDDGDDEKAKKKKRRKEEKEEKKKNKRQRTSDEKEEGGNEEEEGKKKEKRHSKHDEDDHDQNDDHPKAENNNHDTKNKNKPCPGNPQGITRLFLGNLPFAIDDKGLGEFFAPSATVTHIQWITDKETGKFYGSAFVEMDSSASAAHAVGMAGTSLSGRPIKINFAPARPGDVWPPPTKIVTGGSTTSASKSDANKSRDDNADGSGGVIQPMSEKPEGCHKLFIGNLSYEIDDDKLKAFFASVDAEVKAVRWLHHKENGDFKGCGFAEFWNTEACDKAATLNGKPLLGRKIRIDWSD